MKWSLNSPFLLSRVSAKKMMLLVLRGEESEYYRILLLSVYGFCFGIFSASYLVATEALFISRIDTEANAPIAFALQGVIGSAIALLFIFFQKRYTYRFVSKVVSFLCVLVIWVVTIVAFYQEGKMHDNLIFFSFVIYKPIVSLVFIVFWGIFGRLFTIRAFKRLAGGIDSGISASTIIAFFSIPFIKPWFGVHLENFYWLSAISITGTFVCVYFLSKERFEGETTELDLSISASEMGTYQFRRSRFIRLMALFVFCSVLTATIVDYNFLNVSKVQFPKEAELTNFLSFFSGLVVIIGFIIQIFFNDKILELYGIKASLLILPLLLLIYAVAVEVLNLLFGDMSTRIDVFLFLFVLTALSKLFTDALRDSLESPTFKMFFLPIPIKFRFNVQAFVEGFIKEIWILISGLFLIFVSALVKFDWISLNYFIFLILALWTLSVYMLYKQYRKILTQLLSNNQIKSQSAAGNNFNIVNFLTKKLQSESDHSTVLLLKVIERVDPALLERTAEIYPKYKFSAEVKIFLLTQIEKNLLFGAYETLKEQLSSEKNKQVLEYINAVIEKIDLSLKIADNPELLNTMAISDSDQERLFVAQVMSKAYSIETYKILPSLLKDSRLEVRAAALISCGQTKILDLLPLVVDALDEPGLENEAISALVDYGALALPILDKRFYLQETSQNTRIDIIRTVGFIGGIESINFLLKKFNDPNQKVWREILYSLSRCDWTIQSKSSIAAIVTSFLEIKIESYLWNMLALDELESKPENEPLRWALNDEISENFEDIFLYLALLYDKKSVALVRENIESGTDDGISYAIELLDVFLSEHLKRRLIPVLDNISLSDKYNKLSPYFHRDRYEPDVLIEKILSRDFNEMGEFAKASALYALAKNPYHTSITYSIVSLFFAENELLHQTAAYCIAIKDYEYFTQLCKRLDAEKSKRILKLISEIILQDYDEKSRKLIFEKILYFKELPSFKGIIGEDLVEFAINVREELVSKGKTISRKANFQRLPVYVVVSGEIGAFKNGQLVHVFRQNELINDVLFVEFDLSNVNLIAIHDTYLYRINSGVFFENMTDSYRLTEKIVNNQLNLLQDSLLTVKN